MNPVTLALVTQYLDYKQRGKDWHPPLSKRALREVLRRYYFHLSPSTRLRYVS